MELNQMKTKGDTPKVNMETTHLLIISKVKSE